MPPRLDDDVIAGYVRRCLPVEWLIWLGDLSPGVAKSAFKRVLFDKHDRLKGLTAPKVAQNVAKAVLAHKALRAMVEKETAKYIEDAVSALTASAPRKRRSK